MKQLVLTKPAMRRWVQSDVARGFCYSTAGADHLEPDCHSTLRL